MVQLEAGLKASGDELAALKLEREKDANSYSELQALFAEKGKELDAAKNSNADLEVKLAALTRSLDGTKEQETALRPQERQALRRPPTRPPLPQRQAPKSPSQAST